jgi:hypothetical protein
MTNNLETSEENFTSPSGGTLEIKSTPQGVYISGRYEITRDKRGLQSAQLLMHFAKDLLTKMPEVHPVPKSQFHAFLSESSSSSIGSTMTVEDSDDRIALYGELMVAYDFSGRDISIALLSIAEGAISRLKADGNALPDILDGSTAIQMVDNPFS